ncbi:glycosyltransferase family 2 protein [Pedobacter sp.]|uniref:glycosyltransferase family 2 protein n=1 Tax=Pedobacter sp. TaxID=1411316 RepID=UPI003D7FC583
MNSQPSISILTPVWNGLPFIKECVESVLQQEYHDFELLISDNSSTDGTLDYLDTIDDPRVKIFKQEHNLGIMGNVNFLFKNASAPICQILCADDYFTTSSSLTKVIKYWSRASPDIGFVSFGHCGTSNKKIIQFQTEYLPEVIEQDHAEICFFVFGNFPGNLSEVSVLTRLVTDGNNFKTKMDFAGDFDFWSRLSKAVKIGIQKDQIIYVRRHENTASNYGGLKGECYEQHVESYERLIDNLSQTYNRKQLIRYFHYGIYAYHYRVAIKSAWRGRFTYLKIMIKNDAKFLWPVWQRLLFTLPYTLFNRNQDLTFNLAKKILKSQAEEYKHLTLKSI